MYFTYQNPMTNGGDPIEKLMEGKQVSFEDKEKEESKHIEDIQEDLNKEKEINEAQQESKEELSIFSLITRTELLIDKYKELKKEANKLSKNKEDKGYEKEHKSQIENRIRRLEQIKKFLNRYEKKPEHLSAKSLARYDRELLGFQNEIDQFEERRDFIVLEKASGLTPYKIDIHTFKDAKEIRSAYDKVNDMLRKLNSLELDAALRTELKEELEGLQKYLEESINGTIDAGKQPFVLKHWQDFIQLGIIDPTLSNYIVPETTYKKEDKDNNTSVDQPNYVIDKDGNKVCRPVVNYNSPGEARKKGGILGAMDYMLAKTNMTPQQRQFWKGAGNLALVGGGIYLGWKALSSILGFGKDKGKNRRKWIGGIVGGTLLLQGATGKSPIQAIKELFNGGDVTERISGRLGGGVEGSDIGPDTPQEVITYYHGFTGVPAMFAGLKISELKTIIKKDTNGKMKIENYDALALRLDNSKNTAAADIVRKLKIDNDPHNIIHLTLEGMGLNRDKIQEGGDMLFEKYSVDALDRLISINDFMEQNKYEKMNIDGLRDDVKNYVATGNPSLVALEKAGLFSTDGKTEKVAETDLDIKNFNEANDTLGLKDKVDSLSVSENQKKILVAAGNLLSKETNNNKNIEFKEFGGNVYLKTYGEWTPINVARKTISGLDYNSVDIFFESTMEMIKVANLTNYIKKLFRGRSQNLDRPFEITSAVDWIRLNGVGDLVYKEKDKDPNLKRYEIKKYDPSYTEVIDSGWGGDLKGISPILNKYTNEYANYLNSLDIRHVNSKSKNIPN